MEQQSTSGTPDAMRRPGTHARAAAVVPAVLVLLVVLGALLDIGTSSPRLCASCHEMGPSAATWEVSAHARVRCVSCHEAPRPWYARPGALAERGRLLTRDVSRHLAGRLGEPADPQAFGRSSPLPDAICLQCHDPAREATSGFRILIDHVEHAERNGSCVSCHVYTAHPDPARGRPLSLMMRCLDCHGTTETPAASAACETCHPSDFDLRPDTHLADPWMRDHGFSAAADRPLCTMCHEQTYCDSCHGVEMPHPDGWLTDVPQAHGSVSERDPAVCHSCHTDKPIWCISCHHEAFDPATGTWIEQHPERARAGGTVACMQCHAPVFCTRCHAAPADPDVR